MVLRLRRRGQPPDPTGTMTVVEHLTELRKRLVLSVGAVFLGMTADVLGAAAAGVAMVAANVGGIPEIFGLHTEALFAPNIVTAMADAIEIALEDPAAAQARAKSLRERIFLHFSQKAMIEAVLASYREAFADR